MPCSEKIHKVQEKWEKRERREKEELERREREAIPVTNWPKIEKPAEIPNASPK